VEIGSVELGRVDPHRPLYWNPLETIAIGDMFSGFRRMGSLMLGTLISTLAVDIGFALLIVPGIFLMGALVFVPLLILDQGMSPIDEVTRSVDTLKPHAWAMFGLVFVASLLAGLGACLCGVGVLFTAPIYLVTIGISYNNFFPASYGVTAGQPIGIEPPR